MHFRFYFSTLRLGVNQNMFQVEREQMSRNNRCETDVRRSLRSDYHLLYYVMIFMIHVIFILYTYIYILADPYRLQVTCLDVYIMIKMRREQGRRYVIPLGQIESRTRTKELHRIRTKLTLFEQLKPANKPPYSNSSYHVQTPPKIRLKTPLEILFSIQF